MKTKVFLLHLSFLLFVFSCEKEEFAIENITCDKTTIYTDEIVKFECIATAPFPLNYHWMINNNALSSSVVESERNDEFNKGKWIKTKFNKSKLLTNFYEYKESESFEIEVLVYSDEADKSFRGASDNYVIIEYRNDGTVKEEHYFNQDDKGKLWDIHTKDITIYLNDN